MNVGDSVYNIAAHNMIGKIVRLLDNNHAIILIYNKEIPVSLDHWKKVIKE